MEIGIIGLGGISSASNKGLNTLDTQQEVMIFDIKNRRCVIWK